MAEALKTLICGSVRAADSGEAQCARCGAAIYPTSGSLAHARGHAIEMICIACAAAGPDFTFGGFMDHGRTVPISNELAAQLLGMLERQAHRQRQEKSKEQKGKQDDRDSKNG